MKKLAIVLSLIYLASLAVQFNDPDPIRWIVMYGSAMLVAAGTIFRRLPGVLYVVVAGVASLWMLGLLVWAMLDASFTWNEVERELGGLFLVAAGLWTLLAMRRPA